jgi:hypothetical protein
MLLSRAPICAFDWLRLAFGAEQRWADVRAGGQLELFVPREELTSAQPFFRRALRRRYNDAHATMCLPKSARWRTALVGVLVALGTACAPSELDAWLALTSGGGGSSTVSPLSLGADVVPHARVHNHRPERRRRLVGHEDDDDAEEALGHLLRDQQHTQQEHAFDSDERQKRQQHRLRRQRADHDARHDRRQPDDVLERRCAHQRTHRLGRECIDWHAERRTQHPRVPPTVRPQKGDQRQKRRKRPHARATRCTREPLGDVEVVHIGL